MESAQVYLEKLGEFSSATKVNRAEPSQSRIVHRGTQRRRPDFNSMLPAATGFHGHERGAVKLGNMMTKAAVLHWKQKRDIAGQKEKELLRQTSDAVRLRQLQAMFSTARSQKWATSTPEDVALVRARWQRLHQMARTKTDEPAPS